MVSLDQLAALDLVLWLGTTQRAARLALTNQSTISRRSRVTLERFELRLGRNSDGWCLRGETDLLALEREVHQRARLQGRLPLRLQVPYWTRRSLPPLPPGWTVNPAVSELVCEDPVSLLRQRVIDACLVTPTQMPERCDDLLVCDLYRRPIELTLFPGSPAAASRAAPGLSLMPFLPRSCRVRSVQWFEALVAAEGCGASRLPTPGLGVAFLTPEMRAAQDRPYLVDAAVEPYPYVERLLVLAEHAQARPLLDLQDHLQPLLARVAA